PHPHQPRAAPHHDPGPLIGQHLQYDLPGIGGRANRFHGRLDDLRQLDGAPIEVELAGNDARYVEEILDEARLGLRVALDRLERPSDAVWRYAPSAEHPRPREAGGERGAQIVGEDGEEL